LERKKIFNKEKGEYEYEEVNEYHAWNCNNHSMNISLINIQRHSFHHKNASTWYYLYPPSNKDINLLPYGYTTMIIVSLFPSVYFSIVHPRLEMIRKIK
jgi:alkane 1-monooxygenase